MTPIPKKETVVGDKEGLVPSHGISIDIPSTGEGDGSRPAAIRHMYVTMRAFPPQTYLTFPSPTQVYPSLRKPNQTSSAQAIEC